MTGAGDDRDLQTVGWVGDAAGGFLRLIDQTRLPTELVRIDLRDVPAVWEAIRSLRVRGAPAIGIAAAFGVVVGGQSALDGDAQAVRQALLAASTTLRTSRPTAVNLFWALDRIDRVIEPQADSGRRELLDRVLAEARAIEAEDKAMCRAIGGHGAELIEPGQGVLTHCNAGGLATADYGTALAVIFAAHEQGKAVHVFADETRPLLQGARLTAWELQRRGIPVTLICDSMAAQVMKEGRVQIGDRRRRPHRRQRRHRQQDRHLRRRPPGQGPRHPLLRRRAVEHLRPVAPRRRRHPDRAARPARDHPRPGRPTAPDGVDVYNPAFDVTPAELIAAIITEHGVIRPVNAETIRETLARR